MEKEYNPRQTESTPTMHIADIELARRLEQADAAGAADFAAAHVRINPESKADFIYAGGGIAVFAGPESPVTQVIGLGMDGPIDVKPLDSIEAFFRQRNTPVNIEWCPLADSSWLGVLADRGFRLRDHANALICPLETKACGAADSGQPAVRVRRVEQSDVHLWSHVVARGFFDDDEVPQPVLDDLATFFHMSNTTCLLADVDHRPVGGCVVATHQGVASLFGHATIPGFRNRGVQSALIAPSLHLAAETGCDLAVAFTHPGSTSQRNLERHGFRVVYTRSKLVRIL